MIHTTRVVHSRRVVLAVRCKASSEMRKESVMFSQFPGTQRGTDSYKSAKLGWTRGTLGLGPNMEQENVIKANKKIAIADLGLVPRVAILDPSLCVKLPPGVTAATGMDALTHAIESFLGGWSSAFTRKNSLSATQKIFQNILAAYKDGANLDAREAMLNASFEAGIAFTRANVGYVHAIAHQFGGMFHTAHGVANAMFQT